MKIEHRPLEPGLYFVATPIGAARDITLRALDILASADVLAAEDTRTLRRLMQIHGVALGDRRVLAYHDHNGAKMRPRLLAAIAAGQSVAYASDAGTPLVADPGFALAREAASAGYLVTTAPGPSAVLAALTVAGLPTDRFLFAGFAPSAKGARRSWLSEVMAVPATLVIYETAKRAPRLLAEIADMAPERDVALCRELTKRFEEVLRGSASDVADRAGAAALKGEIVLVVDRDRSSVSTEGVASALLTKRQRMSVKDAVKEVSVAFGLPRRTVYQIALTLDKDQQ